MTIYNLSDQDSSFKDPKEHTVDHGKTVNLVETDSNKTNVSDDIRKK